MSRVGTTGAGGVAVEVDAAGVLATLGFIPEAVVGALAVRQFDLMDHHRKSVAKRAGRTWPAGARARRFVFAYSSRYGAKVPNPTRMDQLEGESFLFAPRNVAQPERFWALFEAGGVVDGAGVMTVPFGQGEGPLGFDRLLVGRIGRELARAGGDAAGAAAYGNRARFGIVNAGGRRGLLVDDLAASGRQGYRTVFQGVLRKRVRRRALLGFFAELEAILPRHLARMEAAMERALTLAGREALAAETAAAAERRGAANQHTRTGPGRTEFDRNLRRYLVATGRGGGAGVGGAVGQRIRELAAAAERRDRLAPAGGGG